MYHNYDGYIYSGEVKPFQSVVGPLLFVLVGLHARLTRA